MPDGQKDMRINPDRLGKILQKEFPGYSSIAIQLGESGWLLNPFTGRIYPADLEINPDYEIQLVRYDNEADWDDQIFQPMVILCPDVLVDENGMRVVDSLMVQIRADGKIRTTQYYGSKGPFIDIMSTIPAGEEHSNPVFVGHVYPEPSLIDGTLAIYLVWIDFPDSEAIDVDELLHAHRSIGAVSQVAAAIAYAGAFPGKVQLTPTEIKIQDAYNQAFPDEDGQNEPEDDVICTLDPHAVDDELP